MYNLRLLLFFITILLFIYFKTAAYARVSSGMDFITKTICDDFKSSSTFCQSPTNQPTSIPTRIPTNCKDNNSYKFQNKKRNRKYCKKKIKKNKNKNRKRNKLCRKLDTKNNDRPVSDFCPKYCTTECRILNK